MGKPRGSIGETKLRILAILSRNETLGVTSYGYGVWKTMKDQYLSCLGEDGLRNIYHHLDDLHKLGLINKGSDQPITGAPKRRLYHLTEKGKRLHGKFDRYLETPTIR